MHGHAPRVRRRVNRQTGQNPDPQIIVNKEELLDQVVTSAIGGIVGGIATSVLLGDKN